MGAPDCTIHVIDIDKTVLEQVERVALLLRANLVIKHVDLSQASTEYQRNCDIVISDPFPSGDGSFEAMFWGYAAKILRSGGLSITTVAPSHKPSAYAMGALNQLNLLGFCVIDLQANYGRYEVFDFEYALFELDALARMGLQSNVSHTKSLLTGKYVPSKSANIGDSQPDFNFEDWTEAAATHYLTIQAGVDKQVRIANERGVHKGEINLYASNRGLRIDLIIPEELREKAPKMDLANPAETVQSYVAILKRELSIEVSKEEIEELIRLSSTSEICQQGSLAQLGLAIRAIESWERWRFDER